MGARTTKGAATPFSDAIEAASDDPLLTAAAKRRRILDVRGSASLAAVRSLGLPHTITRNTKRGEIGLTIEDIRHVVANGEPVKNAVHVRVSVTLAGKKLDVDPDRIFVNPPLRDVVDDGENETTEEVRDASGKTYQHVYRWREDPAGIILRQIAEQVLAELKATRAD